MAVRLIVAAGRRLGQRFVARETFMGKTTGPTTNTPPQCRLHKPDAEGVCLSWARRYAVGTSPSILREDRKYRGRWIGMAD